MQPTKDQTTGIIERIAYGLILAVMMKMVQRGYMTADEAPYYAAGIVGGAGSAYAWWINRPKAILQAAGSIPDPNSPTGLTQIVTTPELAQATPENPNIVASTTNAVVRAT